MQEYLEKLNASQREAVETTEGYVRVIAGAGSGKTRALTSRYIYLVDQLGISPSNILCVTFTNKAAREMKTRIRSYIGDNDVGYICTFHSLCAQILRDESRKIGYPNNYSILDDEDQETIIKKVYESNKLSTTDYSIKQAIQLIVKRKTLSGDYISFFEPQNEQKLTYTYSKASSITDKIWYGYLYEQKKIFLWISKT